MKYRDHNFRFIFSGATAFVCCCLLLGSCLKNTDDIDGGPKSQVAISNYVVNGSINVLYDNAALTTAPLGFGGSIATGAGGYTPLPAGVHNLKFVSGTNTVLDNNLSMTMGINYSLFIYDTLQNNKVKTLLITDNLTAVDTVGLIRFLELIPRSDSLTLSLKKDTTYSILDGYVGLKSSEFSTLAFSTSMRPGTYDLKLADKNGTSIFEQTGVVITPGKLYSFIARGAVNGVGDYKPAVATVQHN